MQEVDERAL